MLQNTTSDCDRFCYPQASSSSKNLSRYWTFISIEATGNSKMEEISKAKAFFLSSFPEFLQEREVPHTSIQRQLCHWIREGTPEVHSLARTCLKCYISHQIQQVCQHLDEQFGAKHGFTCNDLLPFVLDDDSGQPNRNIGQPVAISYQSLMHDILQSFDPDQSSLATWTSRRVKHHKQLNAFLLEHGVYLVSDWAILNDTSSKQLQRIFSQFHHLTNLEIQQATQLLESYHSVYRAQRLIARQAGITGKCQTPTAEQLRQIQECLSTRTTQRLSPKAVIRQLQTIASRLREYRVHVRGGTLATKSIDAQNYTLGESISSSDWVKHWDTSDAQTDFLNSYREQLVTCLDQAIAQVLQEKVRKLQNKDLQKAQKFVTALQLFYGHGKSMEEIAPEVHLQAQFQVSRLLKLKSLRADIQQQFMVLLRDRVINEALAYSDSERLQALNEQIEEALDEQVTQVMQEAAKEASTATGTRNQTTTTSLFAERLCRCLNGSGLFS